jgi:cytidylate kinase
VVVTIDGPAGAGKSTVARRLAERIGYRYLDTGAMYRAVTLSVLEDDADPAEAARSDAWRTYEGDPRLRSPEVDAAVSAVAQQPAVRAAMREAQRSFLELGDAVAEGRDIGEVVWPQAELKVWLDAAPEIRARRRGTPHALERDRRDSAQTRIADDAVRIDTSHRSVDDVVTELARLVQERTA